MVELFHPKAEKIHLGGGITMKVELIPPHVGIIPPGMELFHHGGGKAIFPTFYDMDSRIVK